MYSKRLSAVLILAILVFTLPAAAQETRNVTAEGVAAIQQDALDIARDAAIEDAQKKAVEQAIGTLIDSQTQVENFQVISDNILAQTKGYITRYSVLSESKDSGLLRVRISADVSLGKLNDDLSAIGVLMQRMHKPRTMALIAEQNIDGEVMAWWTAGPRSKVADLGVVENVFMEKFSDKGFEFIDHTVAAKEIKVTAAYQTPDLSVAQAKTLGNQADAEVVLIGKVLAKSVGEVMGMRSAQASLTVRAVRTDTGQVIASVTTQASGVHVAETSAGIEALRKVTERASEELITKILASYTKETGGTRLVNLVITGLNKAQLARFKDVMKNQVRGIKAIHERSFASGTAKIQVDSKNSAQLLSDELSLKDFGTFGVEVTGSTANTIELKVVPK